MEFSHWLFLEEQQKYVRTRKDISPKNPDNSFLVLVMRQFDASPQSIMTYDKK